LPDDQPQYIARDLFDQSHIAEFAQRSNIRPFRRLAARDAVADGFVEMTTDFGVEFFVFALSPAFHAPCSFGWVQDACHRRRQPLSVGFLMTWEKSFYLNITYFNRPVKADNLGHFRQQANIRGQNIR
jgi:hypothetical protein